jgi:hypothetical protein
MPRSILVLLLLGFATQALAQGGGGGGAFPWQPTPVGKQYGLSVNSVTSLTVPSQTKCAQIGIEGQNVRYTTDGSNPTAGVGQVVTPGTPLQFCGPALSALKFIAVVAGGILNVDYFK